MRLLTDIRVALFQRLASASRRHRRQLTGAQWLSRLTSDVDGLDTLYLRLIAPTALAALVATLVVAMTAALFDIQTATLVGLVLLVAFLIATLGTYLRTRHLAARQSDCQESLRTAVIEHIEGFAELTAAGRTGKHAAWLMRQAHQVTSEQAQADTLAGWHLAGSHLLINLSAVLTLWAGFALFRAGVVSGPVLVLLPIALLGLAEVYAMLPDAFGKLGATRAAARRLNSDHGLERAAASPAGSAGELPEGFSLQACDITVGYAGYSPLLSHFTLTLRPGDTVGIVGVSGSGKSTLADTLAGLAEPCRGERHSLPCAYLTQATVVFEDTVKANLQLANPNAGDGDMWRVLEIVELAERFAQDAEGLGTWLGSAGNRLSGGEARRLVLARVLLSQAPVVILDEPFTGVDEATRTRISPQISRWLQGRTVVCLGHGPDALLASDRILHLG